VAQTEVHRNLHRTFGGVHWPRTAPQPVVIRHERRSTRAPPPGKNIARPAPRGKHVECSPAKRSYEGQPITLAALKLAPLVFVRPGELRRAEWTEFDLDASAFGPSGQTEQREALIGLRS
jgi:hypothetical protein